MQLVSSAVGPPVNTRCIPVGRPARAKASTHPELVQKVGELQTVAIFRGLICRINPASYVEDLLCRHARPLDNLRTRKFRHCKDTEGAPTSSFHYRCVVQPDE